jgi:hypothetical protein
VSALEGLLWPLSRVGDALDELTRASGRTERPARDVDHVLATLEDVDGLLHEQATARGLEVESIDVHYRACDELLVRGGPMLLLLGELTHPGFLAVLGPAGGRSVWVVAADGARRRVEVDPLVVVLGEHVGVQRRRPPAGARRRADV